MAIPEQLTDQDHALEAIFDARSSAGARGERDARATLRTQVARLERELSGIVAGRFPYVATAPDPIAREGDGAGGAAGRDALGDASRAGRRGPHLLSLGELERLRDSLALRIRDAQVHTRKRDELERDARELLERMRSEPARYKFVRLPVADLGERGCGVWEVRPRLGPIGMLAGWWQLKLSSGCPLAEGPRAMRGPAPTA